MSFPLISVVITCFNRQAYIREAIDSALRQSYENYEIVIIDDGSTDDSAKISKSYGDRVQYFHQDNQGASASKNIGVELARGEFISFLDSDDLWVPNKLQLQMMHFSEFPSVDILHGHARQFVDPDLTPDERAQLYCPTEPMSAPVSGTMLLKKNTFERVGGYRTDLLVGIDIEWHLRAKNLGLSIVTLSDILLHRRIHKTNSGTTHRSNRQQHLSILKEHIDRQRKLSQKK